MGLFALEYRNVPGQCVYAKGGLKFRADEEALSRYFAPILPYVSLNDLIGEAVFWTLIPETVAVWIFPLLLYFKGVFFAILVTSGSYLLVYFMHLVTYSKVLNYVNFFLANRPIQIVVYAIFIIIYIITHLWAYALALGIWMTVFALGLNVLDVLLIAICVKVFSLPPSDQVLRNVGWYYGRKLDMDPSSWEMYRCFPQS
jgi:hypothetical protein